MLVFPWNSAVSYPSGDYIAHTSAFTSRVTMNEKTNHEQSCRDQLPQLENSELGGMMGTEELPCKTPSERPEETNVLVVGKTQPFK